MDLPKVETILNQMKRSDKSQQSILCAAAGHVLVPYAEDRVCLILSSHPTSLLTLSLTSAAGVGLGVTIPAAGAPLRLSLGECGAIVKGPIYAADGTFPNTFSYWEVLSNGL